MVYDGVMGIIQIPRGPYQGPWALLQISSQICFGSYLWWTSDGALPSSGRSETSAPGFQSLWLYRALHELMTISPLNQEDLTPFLKTLSRSRPMIPTKGPVILKIDSS